MNSKKKRELFGKISYSYPDFYDLEGGNKIDGLLLLLRFFFCFF